MSDPLKTLENTNNNNKKNDKINNHAAELINRNDAIVTERSLRNFTALASILTDSTSQKQPKLKGDPESL